MSQFSPSDHPLPPDQADQDAVRALLHTTPIVVVPRDFTLDPAAYRRSRLTVHHVITMPAIQRGLAAAAALIIVLAAVLLSRPLNQLSVSSTANNAVALLSTELPISPSIVPLINSAIQSTSAPLITIIPPRSTTPMNTASAAGKSQAQDQAMGGSLSPNGSPAGAAAPLQPAPQMAAPALIPQSAAQANSSQLAGSARESVTPNAQQRAEFIAFIRFLVDELRFLLR